MATTTTTTTEVGEQIIEAGDGIITLPPPRPPPPPGNLPRIFHMLAPVVARIQSQAAMLAARLLGSGAGAGFAERAAAAAARYPKQLEQSLGMTSQQLQKSISSFNGSIATHHGYLKNPQAHVPNWNQLTPQHQENLIYHWHRDIGRAQDYRDIADGVLRGVLK